MTIVADNRVLQNTELSLLSAAMGSHGSYATAVAAGTSEQLFEAVAYQRVWRALEAHYTETTEAPAAAVLRLRLERWADSLTDVECTTPCPADDVQAVVDELLMQQQIRTRAAAIKQMAQAAARGDVPATKRLLARVDDIDAAVGGGKVVSLFSSPSQIEWLDTASIFAPIPETDHAVRGLQIGPGRPNVIQAYGGLLKTWIVMSAGLSISAGRPVWNYFEADARVVGHLDYEMGSQFTRRRYQRLALGHNIDTDEIAGRLRLCVLPRIYLDQPGAYDAYAKACEGLGVCIIDSLRACTPNTDENDSSIRHALDTLTQISERHGITFLVLHHEGKPNDDRKDAMHKGRGSSGIWDASGCVLGLTKGARPEDPRNVTQLKQPPSAVGGKIPAFRLQIEDVEFAGDRTAGARIVWSPATEQAEAKQGASTGAQDDQVLAVLQKNPGASQNELRGFVREVTQLGNSLIADSLVRLQRDGRVRADERKGRGGGTAYWPADKEAAE